MDTKDEGTQVNEARRHVLGLAMAIGARIAMLGAPAATILSASSAEAARKPWWKIGGWKGHRPGGGPGNKGGPLCLLSGTSVRTPAGEARIESLRIGDLVETMRGQALPIKWIGRQIYRRSNPIWSEEVVPIRIARYALDGRRPHKDLYLSPRHGLYLNGVLIQAKDLVNGRSITQLLPDDRDTIEYFHIVLDTHEVVWAEGAPVETFLLEDRNYERFTNFVEFARLYPGDVAATMTPFAPIVGYAGREHLKALLHLASGRLIPPSPLQDAYERIAALAGRSG